MDAALSLTALAWRNAGSLPSCFLPLDVRARGPCPPQGSPPHRYVFTLHALDAPLDLPEGSSRQELEDAIDGRVLATTTLTGLYARAIP